MSAELREGGGGAAAASASAAGVGILAADYRVHIHDVCRKLLVERHRAKALQDGVPSLSDLAGIDVLLVWTASWRSDSESTEYDRRKTGNLLADFVDNGGSVVMCYTNPEPSGRWAEEKYSPFAVQGVYLVKAMPPTEVACRGLGDVTIGGPVWVNRVKLQPRAGGRASVDCCRWPGPGRQHREGLVATRVAAAAGHGGVVALNVYPPSRDAQSAPAATLWSSSQTDLRPLFKAAIASAAGLTRGASNAVAAEEDGSGGDGAPSAISAAEVQEVLRIAISRGVPLWNAGQQAECTAIYLATCRALCEIDVRLAAAANKAAREDANRGGWTLRHAMDAVLRSIATGAGLENHHADEIEGYRTIRDAFDAILLESDSDHDDESIEEDEEEEEDAGEEVWRDPAAGEVAARLVCPITQRVMKDPVICADGNTYERSAILRWFRTKAVSPMTNLPIDTSVVPNLAVKEEIAEYRQRAMSNGSAAEADEVAAAPAADAANVVGEAELSNFVVTEDDAASLPPPAYSPTVEVKPGEGKDSPCVDVAIGKWLQELGLKPGHIAAVAPWINATGATEPRELADLLEDAEEGLPAIDAIVAALPLAKRKSFRRSLDKVANQAD